jgi:hypothetical protein
VSEQRDLHDHACTYGECRCWIRQLCANNAALALNGSFTVATGGVWSGGAGTFSPSTTNMNATYTPSAAEIASGFA